MVYGLTRRGFFSELNVLVCHYAYALSLGEDVFVDESMSAVRWRDLFEPTLQFQRDLDAAAYDHITLCHPRLGRPEWNARRLWVKHACDENLEVNLPGDGPRRRWRDLLFEVSRELIQPRADLRESATEAMRVLGLADVPFGAIHIRRGDKTEGYVKSNGKIRIEGEAVGFDEYAAALERLSPGLRRIFVMTDDHREVATARANWPEFEIVSLCSLEDRGYRQTEFRKLSYNDKLRAIRRLVIEVLIAARSTAFAGLYRSNVSLTIATLHQRPEFCCSVDSQARWSPVR